MPHYVTLLRYTQQGAAKIKESPARLDAAKKAAEAAGGKIHAWYLTMGKYALCWSRSFLLTRRRHDSCCRRERWAT